MEEKYKNTLISERFYQEYNIVPEPITITIGGNLGIFKEVDGKLTFEGNIDEAGKIFVDFICYNFNERIKYLNNNMKTIIINKSEIQSGLDRVKFAEGLILQLPNTHNGRNSWLLNYGISDEAIALRTKRNIGFDEITNSAELIKD